MIIDKIEPIALRIGTLSLVLCRVTTKSGLVGYGECLCNRPPMQQALVATIRDAIAPVYLGQSAEGKEALNLTARRRFASFGRAGTVTNALAAVDIALWDIAGKAVRNADHRMPRPAFQSRRADITSPSGPALLKCLS